MMKRVALIGFILVNCTCFGAELFAQSSQTVNPVPLTPPSLQTTTLTCQINCDTAAMNCMNSCPTGVTSVTPGATAGATANPSCNLNCSSAQLVCKQRC
jgi:hypothetical protein